MQNHSTLNIRNGVPWGSLTSSDFDFTPDLLDSPAPAPFLPCLRLGNRDGDAESGIPQGSFTRRSSKVIVRPRPIADRQLVDLGAALQWVRTDREVLRSWDNLFLPAEMDVGPANYHHRRNQVLRHQVFVRSSKGKRDGE